MHGERHGAVQIEYGRRRDGKVHRTRRCAPSRFPQPSVTAAGFPACLAQPQSAISLTISRPQATLHCVMPPIGKIRSRPACKDGLAPFMPKGPAILQGIVPRLSQMDLLFQEPTALLRNLRRSHPDRLMMAERPRLDLAAKIQFLAARNWFWLALLPRSFFGLRYKTSPKTRIVMAPAMVGGVNNDRTRRAFLRRP